MLLKNFFKFFFLNCKISLRHTNSLGITLFFYINTIFLFPLCIGDYFLHNILLITSVFWINIILAILLTLDVIYRTDYTNGTLDYIIIYPQKLKLLILAKAFSHWVLVVLPLIIITPFFGFSFGLNIFESLILFLSLFIGTPALILIGMFGVSLTLTTSKGGMLLSLLILPFYIPIVIFGISSIVAINYGINIILANLSILLSFTILSWLFFPHVIMLTLKIGVCS